MNYVKNIEKNLNSLKSEFVELEEFKDTYSKVVSEIQALVKQLFEEPLIKKSKKYEQLKEAYHDKILAFFKQENFTQLVVETHVPGIYDPPGKRGRKLPVINKEKIANGSGPVTKKVTKISPKKTTTAVSLSTATTKPKSSSNGCLLGDSDDEDGSTHSNILTNDLHLNQEATQINLKIKDIEELPEPILYPLQINGETGTYYYDQESQKIYQESSDLPKGIGQLVGNYNIDEDKVYLGSRCISVC